MKSSLFRGLVGLLVGLLLSGCVSVKAADARIVLIAGRPSHPPGMHEFRAGALLHQKCLAGFPGVRVEVYSNGWPTKVVGGQVVDDSAVLLGAAAVVIYADGGSGHPALQADHLRFLDGLADQGVGLGFAHYGVEVPKGDPGEAFKKWVGGYYESLYSVNPMWAPRFETFPVHPVTRGVKPFSTRDEWYFNMRWADGLAGVTPILTAEPSDEVRKGPYVYPSGPYQHIIDAHGRTETMMWVKVRENGGRAFGFTGGHTHRHWGDPNQRKVFLNALLWLAKVEVPADGVESSVSDVELGDNLDPKGKKVTVIGNRWHAACITILGT